MASWRDGRRRGLERQEVDIVGVDAYVGIPVVGSIAFGEEGSYALVLVVHAPQHDGASLQYLHDGIRILGRSLSQREDYGGCGAR